MSHEPFDEADRDLLADLLSGVRAEGEPEVAARLRDRPALAAELAELRALAGSLEAGGRERWQEIEAARDQVTAADLRQAQGAVATLARRRRLPMVGVLLALAGVLAVAVLLFFRPLPEQDTKLGGDTVKDLTPNLNEPGTFEEFRWRADLPAGCWFSLQVYAAPGRVKGASPLVSVSDLGEKNRWQPNADDLAILRSAGEIWWVVTIEGTSGTPDHGEAYAKLLR